MPNIFDGLRKISDEDIIEQIVLLETINITNISKPIAQKAKKKTIGIINFIGSKIGKNNIIKEPEVKEIWTLIDEKKDELKNCTRIELDDRLFNVLVEKLKNDLEDLTEDEVSVNIIEEAAKSYKIYKNFTPAQKADNIYLKYCEKIKGEAEEYLKNLHLMELKETTKNIEETFRSIDEEQKENFEQAVDVEKLTLLNAWKKVDRQLFVRIVWLSVRAFSGKFTPNKEILPSFMKNEKEIEAETIKEKNNLNRLQEELLELKNKIKCSTKKMNSIEKNLRIDNSLLSDEIKNKNQNEEDIIKLEKIILNLEEVEKLQEDKLKELEEQMEKENSNLTKLDLLMEDFKKLKFDLIDITNKIFDVNRDVTFKNQLIKDYIKEIENTEKNIKELASEFEQVKIEKDNLIKTYNEKEKEVSEKEKAINEKEKMKINEIFKSWSEFFDKFTFEFSNLSHIASFNREELLQIEECLYELHFTKNPIALSMGLIEDKSNKEEYSYIDITFSNKFEIEIQYKLLDNEEKHVHILEITTKF